MLDWAHIYGFYAICGIARSKTIFAILIVINCQIVFQRGCNNWQSQLQLFCPLAIKHLSSSVFSYTTKQMHTNEWKATTKTISWVKHKQIQLKRYCSVHLFLHVLSSLNKIFILNYWKHQVIVLAISYNAVIKPTSKS